MMVRAGKTLVLGSLLALSLFGCGTPETEDEKAKRIEKERSFEADIQSSPQTTDAELIKRPGLQLAGENKTVWLYRDVATYGASGSKVRCLSTIPEDLPVAKVFCDDTKASLATLKAGDLPKFCLLTGAEEPKETDLNFDCNSLRIVPLRTNPPLFIGFR